MNARPRWRVHVVEKDGTPRDFESDQPIHEIALVADMSHVRELKVERIAPPTPTVRLPADHFFGEDADD